jgi:hypothetical protein
MVAAGASGAERAILVYTGKALGLQYSSRAFGDVLTGNFPDLHTDDESENRKVPI